MKVTILAGGRNTRLYLLNMALHACLGVPGQADSGGPRFMFHNTTFTTFTFEPKRLNWRMLNFDDRRNWKDEE